ncbi:MAG: M28 family peptidase [Actinobacteria bacterium]|nr:M28 family peptidase [Actinomycetota bacterium]
MEKQHLYNKSIMYLQKLCNDINERCVGSEGNRKATTFFNDVLLSMGWVTETPEFSVMDWIDGGATLKADHIDFKVLVSPYSLGCSVNAQLASATNISELEKGNFQDKILLLHGDIAKEQLMPKNFVFYNPEEHQKIISLLEKSKVKAIICAVGRNTALAGGVCPSPLIEDGDFNIPSVYTTEEESKRLLPYIGKEVSLQSNSKRIPSTGYDVIGRKNENGLDRIVVTAHIDTKKGMPGATDNATGIAVLLILAELLEDYSGDKQIELVAFNGEDYYAVPGQMNYIMANQDKFDNILLNINIDGAAYKEGKSTFSFFDLPDNIHKKALEIIREHPEITEGALWLQGDHSIFIQHERPAIAISSQWFTENADSQNVIHTT